MTGAAHAVPEDLGRASRRRAAGRHLPPLHRPPSRPRGHQPAGLRGPAADRPQGAPARRHPGRARPQRADQRPLPADRRRDLAAPGRHADRATAREFGVELFGMRDVRQGIVHVIGPEQGFTLPGTTIVCGDSHTSTHGAFGALAFGIGTSEVEHVLATQTLVQKKPEDDADQRRRRAAGRLHRQGRDPRHHRQDRHRRRHRLRGRVCRQRHPRPVDGRPDDRLQHVDRGRCPRRADRARTRRPSTTSRAGRWRPRAPTGSWPSAGGAPCPPTRVRVYDTEIRLDAATIEPQVTWGTSPQDVVPITGAVPDPKAADQRGPPPRHGALAGIYGPEARHADGAGQGRHRVHRLLHQRPDRGSARRRQAWSRASTSRRPCAPWSSPAPAS